MTFDIGSQECQLIPWLRFVLSRQAVARPAPEIPSLGVPITCLARGLSPKFSMRKDRTMSLDETKPIVDDVL